MTINEYKQHPCYNEQRLKDAIRAKERLYPVPEKQLIQIDCVVSDSNLLNVRGVLTPIMVEI